MIWMGLIDSVFDWNGCDKMESCDLLKSNIWTQTLEFVIIVLFSEVLVTACHSVHDQ